MYFLSYNLRNLRDDAFLTQYELALKLDTSQQMISKVENGGLPDLILLIKISEFFEITLDDLIYNKGVLPGSKRDRLKYINSTELLMLLDNDDRDTVDFMVEFLIYKKKIKEKRHKR